MGVQGAAGLVAEGDGARIVEDEASQPLLRDLAQRSRGSERVAPVHATGNYAYECARMHGPGWMLLGDAAGFVDPITREGIFFALQSADAAADAILGRAEPSRAYAERVRREIVSELSRAARLKARFFAPAFVALLITALEQSAGIRAVMADLVAGQQPYAGLKWRLAQTLELGLAWRWLRS